jgi:hypothetical protein
MQEGYAMARETNLPFECHIDHNVRAFVVSSDRVRYVLIAITVTSILIFAGHYNALSESWFNSRLSLARLALETKAWEPTSSQPETPQAETAREWAKARRLRTEEDVKEQINFLEELRINHFLILQMPIFGVSFDVNDLGLLGSIALLTMLLMLLFAMARQSENLYLSLWKVKEIWRLEGRVDKPDSDANLVYHSLAMHQHFSNPPTLARWKIGRLRNLANIFLSLPLLAQAWGLYLDWSTRDVGVIVNGTGTIVSLWVQAVACLIMLVLIVCCYLFIRANDIRWNNTFLLINRRLRANAAESLENIDPDPKKRLKAIKAAPWLVWVKVLRPRNRYYPPNAAEPP